MTVIPIRALPEFVEDVTLDETPYRLRVKWNTRGAYYTVEFATAAGVALVSGMKLALNASLLLKHPDRGLPAGEIVVIDPSGGTAKIAFEDFDTRVSLVYLTEAEYAAL